MSVGVPENELDEGHDRISDPARWRRWHRHPSGRLARGDHYFVAMTDPEGNEFDVV